MAAGPDRPSARGRPETGRLVVGALAEFGIKAYGAAAAVSVAVSDAETVAGKGRDAVAAVSNLKDRYNAAASVFERREEIQEALDSLSPETLTEEEALVAVNKSSEALRDIETTANAVKAAKDAVGDLSPFNAFGKAREAAGHIKDAIAARPETESIGELAAFTEQAGPVVDEVEVLTRGYYGGLVQAADNFSSDEIVGTLGVMAAALGLAFILGHAVGFWARRGRPGLLARTLQRWGARVFRSWYVGDPQRTLGEPLYAAARERLQRDIVADPQEALDPHAFRDLESWFASRSDGAA